MGFSEQAINTRTNSNIRRCGLFSASHQIHALTLILDCVGFSAQASQVDEFLKYAVAELQGQARQLELEIQILLGTTQQLENNITSKHTGQFLESW